jgi:hypothetical protein
VGLRLQNNQLYYTNNLNAKTTVLSIVNYFLHVFMFLQSINLREFILEPTKSYIINRTPPNSATLYENRSPGEPINIKFWNVPFIRQSVIISGPKRPL